MNRLAGAIGWRGKIQGKKKESYDSPPYVIGLTERLET
jgi:hypothetical protein